MDTINYTWYKVTDTPNDKRLPENGKTVGVVINDKKLCLAKVNDTFYATQDNCPHAMAPLAKGWIEDEDLVCPVHQMKFNVKTGKNTTGEGYHIACYPVEVNTNGVFIGFNKKSWFQFWKK